MLEPTWSEVGSHAGREDLDVRMLGSGRPFVLELADARGAMPPPRRLQELQEQLAASGAGVEVLKLQAAPKSVLKTIKVHTSACQRSLQRARNTKRPPALVQRSQSCRWYPSACLGSSRHAHQLSQAL